MIVLNNICLDEEILVEGEEGAEVDEGSGKHITPSTRQKEKRIQE